MQDDLSASHLASLDRTRRVKALERALVVVRRSGDRTSERILCSWLDDLYVGRAHLRASDRDIVRLRRQLRGVA